VLNDASKDYVAAHGLQAGNMLDKQSSHYQAATSGPLAADRRTLRYTALRYISCTDRDQYRD